MALHIPPRHVLLIALLAATTTAILKPGSALAQENRVVPALLGGALGLGVGGYVSIGIWSYKAQEGDYLFAVTDALGWEATPILAGVATGAVVGWLSQERLRRAAYIGIGSGLVGTAVGAVVGNEIWQPPQGRWAGGIIGGGAGLLLGAAIGMFWPLEDEDGAPPAGVPLQVRVPVGF